MGLHRWHSIWRRSRRRPDTAARASSSGAAAAAESVTGQGDRLAVCVYVGECDTRNEGSLFFWGCV